MTNDVAKMPPGARENPSHFVLQHMDPELPLREFRERIFHFHAKDVKLDRSRMNETGVFAFPSEWQQPRIPGFGEIDWGRFVGAIMETGYDGPVCIEVEDDTFGKSLDGRKNALRVAGNVLRPFFP